MYINILLFYISVTHNNIFLYYTSNVLMYILSNIRVSLLSAQNMSFFELKTNVALL